MSVLEIKNLSHIFDAKPLFHNAELTINNGEHVGIVGLNGAGKSTFINIIAGNLSQDEGEVKWHGALRRGYLDQHANIDRSQTVMQYLTLAFDNLYQLNARMEQLYLDMESMNASELDKAIQKANRMLETLTDSGFFELDATIKKVANGLGIGAYGYDTLISKLSGGQRAKLMLARLLLEKPDVMMLDEPTNFLDAEHIEWLCEFLNSFKGTFMVISHDVAFLDKVCKFIVSIENGSIRKYGGNYSQYVAQAEQNAKQYEESYRRQQAEIARMEEYIARNKARAATAGMANSRKKMLDKMVVLDKPTVIYDAEFNFGCVPLHTREMIVVKNLEIGYGGVALLPPISFTAEGDTKLWIKGTNGTGKTTLIKTLLGIIPAVSGSVTLHPFIKAGYIEQEIEFLGNPTNATTYINSLYPRLTPKEVRASLSKVGIKNELAIKAMGELSGGEQVRIKLCGLTLKTTNLLILDEPTNHLDVRAKDSLKKALIDYQGALIVVSHEPSWASEICNKQIDVKG